VTYYMADLTPPVLNWLSDKSGQGNFYSSSIGTNASSSTR
jgi:hypothetical protein